MYETHFKLQSRPFVPTPQTGSYFPATVIENARQTLVRTIDRAEGPALITGPPGTGKTMLCHLLVEHFQDELAVAMLSNGRLKSCEAMLQAVLYELGLPYQGMKEGELRLALIDFLEPHSDRPGGLLLVVDEAHTLPWRLLDEVRLITNVVRNGQPRVRVVLAGGASLEERFASPKLGSFAQRVASRCYLEPLNGSETAQYVRSQLTRAGGDAARLLDDAALRSIYRASDGIPRLINQVCDHALILASLGGHTRLSGDAIDEAWADLQQLPTPWTQGSQSGPASGVVEFGDLDDEVPEALPFRGAEAPSPHLLETGEPAERLEAIADQLSSIEREPPDVTANTEADLDFPEYCDPFGERFAEEEVLVDRYGSGTEIFADVPRVRSWEGRQLGAELQDAEVVQPWKKLFDRPDVKLAHPAASQGDGNPADAGELADETAELDELEIAEFECGEVEAGERPADEPPAGAVEFGELEVGHWELGEVDEAPGSAEGVEAWTFDAASDPILPEDLLPEELPAASAAEPCRAAAAAAEKTSDERTESPRPPAGVTKPRRVQELTGVSSDRDVIVIEDEAMRPAMPMSAGPARQGEFRQLFAKLRRG